MGVTKKKVGGMSFFNSSQKTKNAVPVSKSYSDEMRKRNVSRTRENRKSSQAYERDKARRMRGRKIRNGYVSVGRTMKNAGKYLSRSVRNSRGESGPMEAIFRRYYDKSWYHDEYSKRLPSKRYKTDYIKILNLEPQNLTPEEIDEINLVKPEDHKEIKDIKRLMQKFNNKYYYYKQHATDSKKYFKELKDTSKELLPLLNNVQDTYIKNSRQKKNSVLTEQRITNNTRISKKYVSDKTTRSNRRLQEDLFAKDEERANTFVSALKRITDNPENATGDKVAKNLKVVEEATRWIKDNKEKKTAKAGVKKVSQELELTKSNLEAALYKSLLLANASDNGDKKRYIEKTMNKLKLTSMNNNTAFSNAQNLGENNNTAFSNAQNMGENYMDDLAAAKAVKNGEAPANNIERNTNESPNVNMSRGVTLNFANGRTTTLPDPNDLGNNEVGVMKEKSN